MSRSRFAAVGRRLLHCVLTLLAVSGVLFAAVEVLPGDVAIHILGPHATSDRVATLRSELDLDEPAIRRYGRWLAGATTGDLGSSATTGRPVADVIGGRLRNTGLLATAAFLAIAVVAVGLGTLASRRPGGPVDSAVSIATVTAMATPEFVVAGLLVVGIAFGLGWFPAVSLVPAGGTPLDRPEILVLPTAALTIAGGAFGARLVRAVMIDAAGRPHVEAARLAGLAERTVLLRHLLPTAIGPIAQVLAFMVPYLVGGTIVIERAFSYPGLGGLLLEAVAARDATVVLAIGLLLAAVVVAAFAIADMVVSATGRRTEAW